jgi:hypothetical protein
MKVKTEIRAGIINFSTGTVGGSSGGTGGTGSSTQVVNSGVSLGVGGNSGGTVG